MKKQPKHTWHNFLLPALLVSAVFAVFYPALDAGFVFDDPLLIEDNPLVNGEAPIYEAFIRPYFDAGGRGIGFFRPLIPILFRAEMLLFLGHPFWFHLTNLLIHCGAVYMLYRLCRTLGASPVPALGGCLLFAVHPVNCESVAWISGRTDPLVLVFMGLSLIFLCRYLRHRKEGGDALALAFSQAAFFCALLVKETAFVLPALVFCLCATFSRRTWHRAGPLTGAFGLVALVVFLIARSLPWGDSNSVALYTGRGDLWERGLTFLSLVPDYLAKIFSPEPLCLARPTQLVSSLSDSRVLAGAALLGLFVLVLLIGLRFRKPLLAVGAALLVCALLSVANIVPIPYGFEEMDFPFFERYLYVPLAGLVLLLVGLFPNEGKGALKGIFLGAVLCAVPFLGKASWERTHDWQCNRTLFYSGVKTWPESPSLYFNLGQALFEEHKTLEALAAFQQALRLNPSLTLARVHEAIALARLGKAEEGLGKLSTVLEDEPENGQAMEALGYLQAREENWQEALDAYNRAIPLLNHNASTVTSRNRAAFKLKGVMEQLYLEKQDFQGLLTMADFVLQRMPDCTWALEGRGLALFALGREEEAKTVLEKALETGQQDSLMAIRRLIEIYDKEGSQGKAQQMRILLDRALDEIIPPEAYQQDG